MISSFSDPFDALFALQRALEARFASDWLGSRTAGMGSYPPINIFQQAHDYVAVVELPGIDKNNLQIEAKENTIRISGTKTADVTIIKGAVDSVLKATGAGDILVNSSASVIKALLSADLLDRLYLMIFPEIAGGGKRLFDDGLPASKWTLTHQETGELGEIALVYDRVR